MLYKEGATLEKIDITVNVLYKFGEIVAGRSGAQTILQNFWLSST